MNKENLNNILIRHTDWNNVYPKDLSQADHSIVVDEKVRIEAIFKNLEDKVVEKIEKSSSVVGCVAWLTSNKILAALAKTVDGVSIIVQKEDFLRPDIDSEDQYIQRLQKQYSELKGIYPTNECRFEEIVNSKGEFSRSETNISIRCVGNAKKVGQFALPRMHHKFFVFCNPEELESYWLVKPYAVWTGSFNMTKNATMSVENAVYIENEEIAMSYFLEWHSMLMISERLDWTSEYAAPDIQSNNLGAHS